MSQVFDFEDLAREQILNGTAPENLSVRSLNFSKEKAALHLPIGLTCFDLDLSQTEITSLPKGIRVLGRLNLSNCPLLETLPNDLEVGSLLLRNCVSLEALPENLVANFLDASGCVSLVRWPDSVHISIGSVNLRNARSLEKLPVLGLISSLNLAGCSGIREIAEGTRISSWLDIGGSAIRSLPASLSNVSLRWRGVKVDRQITFHPETLSPKQVLTEANVEKRRVMLERIGYERFFEAVHAEVLDIDTDPGGERKLLKIDLPGDEALVCVAVSCPSTARRYVIRVPPTIRKCQHAIAWTAGFDNFRDYHPIVET